MLALIAAVPAVLVAVLTFLSPTLAAPDWTPFLRGLGALGAVVVIGLTAWWAAYAIRDQRRR